jgi:hypothetical protein
MHMRAHLRICMYTKDRKERLLCIHNTIRRTQNGQREIRVEQKITFIRPVKLPRRRFLR